MFMHNDFIHKYVVCMKVNKSQAVDALIAILDVIYNVDSVRTIREKLTKLDDGETIAESKVEEIFGSWADYNPDPQDSRKAIKFICAYIKEVMFK